MKSIKVPLVTIPRLSLYYRALGEQRTPDFISSREIASLTGFSAAQVRKDLAYFGQFGVPGRGYQVKNLKQSIVKILGTDRAWSVVLVGTGNLGSALLSYKGFSKQGFNIVAAFDNDAHKTGKTIKGIKVKDIGEIEEQVKLLEADMAIVTVPQNAAQEVINKLVRAGVRAILNFAPLRPQVSGDVEVLNIDLSIELERLAYFLARARKR
jgi:redox-sensing transcriptional repressor